MAEGGEEQEKLPPEILAESIAVSQLKCRARIKVMKHKIDIYWFKGTLENQLCAYKDRDHSYPKSGHSPRVETYKSFQGREATKVQSLFRSYRSRRRYERLTDYKKRIRHYSKEQYVHKPTRLLIFYNVKPCKMWVGLEDEPWHVFKKNKRKRNQKEEVIVRRSCVICAAVVIQGAFRRFLMELNLERERQKILHGHTTSANEADTGRNELQIHSIELLRAKLDLNRNSILIREQVLRDLKASIPAGEKPTKEQGRRSSALKACIRQRKRDQMALDKRCINLLGLKPRDGHVLTTPPLRPSLMRKGAATLLQGRIRIFLAKQRSIERRWKRSQRLKKKHTLRMKIQMEHRRVYWTRVNGDLRRRRFEGARCIQNAWRCMKSRKELLRRKQTIRRRFLQRWWRGCLARHTVIWNARKERERNRFRHRVLFRLSHQSAVWAINGWREYMRQEQLWRSRLYLAREIAESKWNNHCAARIQRQFRIFLSRRDFVVNEMLPTLHPRLRNLVMGLLKTRDWHTFVGEVLRDSKTRNNPEPRLVLDAERLGFPLPLMNVDENTELIHRSVDRWLGWRPNPLPGSSLPTCMHYMVKKLNEQYYHYVTLTNASCDIVQRVQEEAMIAQLTKLLLSDTYDFPKKRWDNMGQAKRRVAMSSFTVKKDSAAFSYLRWFLDGEDLCGHCGALLSWNDKGKCTVCSKHRYEMETASVASRTKKFRLGTRSIKRQRLAGLHEVKEPVYDFLCHAAFCVYAPAGSWKRLMPKTKAWEDSRSMVEGMIKQLNRQNIHTIGSLWLSVISGEFQTLGFEREISAKIIRLLKMLHVEIMTWLQTGNAPTGSVIYEDYDSTFLPEIPSRLSLLPSLEGSASINQHEATQTWSPGKRSRPTTSHIVDFSSHRLSRNNVPHSR